MDREKILLAAFRLAECTKDACAASCLMDTFNRIGKARPDLDDEDRLVLAVQYVDSVKDFDQYDFAFVLGSSDCLDRREALVDKGFLYKEGDTYHVTDIELPPSVDGEDLISWKEFRRLLLDLLGDVFSLNHCSNEFNLGVLKELFSDSPFWARWEKYTPSLSSSGEHDMFGRLVKQFITCGPIPLDISESKEGLTGIVEKGLAEIIQKKDSDDEDVYQKAMLSVPVCRTLFRGLVHPPFAAALSHSAVILRPEDIPAKELFYNSQDEARIGELRDIMDRDVFLQIAVRLASMGRPAGVACLLYGPPGTGKTELVRQMARESGRTVVSVDAARITGRYMGESEKAVRELFRSYRYIYAVSDTVPIMLMNEADGLLWRREEDPNGSAARSYNVIQSLFLDEMDSFEGILIATTNLPRTFDGAIMRRFLLKTRVGEPDAATRERIWRSQLPFLDGAQAYALASCYPLTGGLISNVAARCGMYEVLKGARPSFEQVQMYCEAECGEGSCDGVVMRVPKGKNYS